MVKRQLYLECTYIHVLGSRRRNQPEEFILSLCANWQTICSENLIVNNRIFGSNRLGFHFNTRQNAIDAPEHCCWVKLGGCFGERPAGRAFAVWDLGLRPRQGAFSPAVSDAQCRCRRTSYGKNGGGPVRRRRRSSPKVEQRPHDHQRQVWDVHWML